MLTDLMMDGSGDDGLSYTYNLSAKREHMVYHLSHISSQYHEVCGRNGATNQDQCFHNYIHVLISLWIIKFDRNGCKQWC